VIVRANAKSTVDLGGISSLLCWLVRAMSLAGYLELVFNVLEQVPCETKYSGQEDPKG